MCKKKKKKSCKTNVQPQTTERMHWQIHLQKFFSLLFLLGTKEYIWIVYFVAKSTGWRKQFLTFVFLQPEFKDKVKNDAFQCSAIVSKINYFFYAPCSFKTRTGINLQNFISFVALSIVYLSLMASTYYSTIHSYKLLRERTDCFRLSLYAL